jgi:hypothetical protein
VSALGIGGLEDTINVVPHFADARVGTQVVVAVAEHAERVLVVLVVIV